MISNPLPPVTLYQQPVVVCVVAASGPGSQRHYPELLIRLEGSVMFRGKIGPDTLPDDMVEYLNYRVKETGVSFWDAYNEEMGSRATATREALSLDELKMLANSSVPNPQLFDGDEECPF